MTPADAARVLSIEISATPEQLEARFLELRARLEEKIAKAPTPGLKEKYRASLTEITTAFETLTLAADASTLPVLQREPDGGSARPAPAAQPGSPAPAPPPSTRSTKSTKEFAIVALLAVLVLGGGGWWVVKTRAEKAEQARVAAETARAAADEAARQERMLIQLRTQLAESSVLWEARAAELRDAERRANEAKSELRSAREGEPTLLAELSSRAARWDLYTTWLQDYLLRHPAKLAMARTEQLLAAKAVDETAAAAKEMADALASMDAEIEQRKEYLLEASARVQIETKPAGIKYVFTDAYGRTFEGTTPAEIPATPLTHLLDPLSSEAVIVKLGEHAREKIQVRFIRPGWKDQVVETSCMHPGLERMAAAYEDGELHVSSLPEGVPFRATNDLGWNVAGKTPARLTGAPPGPVQVILSRPGFTDVKGRANVPSAGSAQIRLDQRTQQIRISVREPEAEIWIDGKMVGRHDVTLTDHPPGQHQLELRHPKWARYRATIQIQQEASSRTFAYDFQKLAARTETCTACKGAGSHTRESRCNACRGSGRVRCTTCKGRGTNTWDMLGEVRCSYCDGTGREECYDCEATGKRYTTSTCTRCEGHGKLSRLFLNQ